MPRVTFQLTLLPGTPTGTLFLTGDHRAWSDDPAGWTFREGVLHAELPDGLLAQVKVRRVNPDGTTTEEGDPWGGRARAHRVVVRGDTTVPLTVPGWQDGPARTEIGRAHV